MSGYTAAISQSVFGVGSGAGAGPACGTCYQLFPEGGTSIKVKVNDLCPVENNPICRGDAGTLGLFLLKCLALLGFCNLSMRVRVSADMRMCIL